MIVHEIGHVVAAWLTGGVVQRVDLHPMAISRTDVNPNPQPLAVAWAGPILGSALPVIALLVASALKFRLAFLTRFFAGFCLVANGLYISCGSFDSVGDAGDMLKNGSPIWSLWLFGLLTAPVGFWLWHGLGPQFGLGEAHGEVDRAAAWFSLAALLVVVVFELA